MLAAAQRMDSVDSLNLHKIEWYLEHYEYPSKKIFQEEISITPALVVHHVTNVNTRRRLYPKFKVAYENDHLDADFFALYLGRIYQLEKGTYFRMPSPYQLEDQIDSLITVLKLE